MNIRVYLPGRDSYIIMTTNHDETVNSFKKKLLNLMLKKKILTHLTSTGMNLDLFCILERSTGRPLLDDRKLYDTYFLFGTPNDNEDIIMEICLVEKETNRRIRSHTIESSSTPKKNKNKGKIIASTPPNLNSKNNKNDIPDMKRIQSAPTSTKNNDEIDNNNNNNNNNNNIVKNNINHPSWHPNDRLHNKEPYALELADESYDAIKINQRGRRQRRVLKLTHDSIWNVRNGRVTASHKYSDVLCVTLADHETLVISFLNDQDVTYVSPIAMQIVQDINRRLALRRHNEKRSFTYNLANLVVQYQEKLHRSSNKKNISNNSTSENAREVLFRVLSDGTKKMTRNNSNSSKTHRKLQSLLGTTEEERLQQSIDRVLIDSSTEEGRARQRFLKNFSVLERKENELLEITRQFMDSLRQFMETQRAEEFARVLIRKKTSNNNNNDNNNNNNNINDDDDDDDDGIMNADRILKEYGIDICPMVERSLESAIVAPVYQRIVKCLDSLCSDRQATIAMKVVELRMKSQGFFGIQKIHQSSTNWSQAIFEMGHLDEQILPQDKLEVLLNTARAIYHTYNFERREMQELQDEKQESIKNDNDDDVDKEPTTYYLAADEFFPIFVFVVVNSSVRMHEMNKLYMWGLCDRSSLSGEGGYYLTVYEACIEYIFNLDIQEIEASTRRQAKSNASAKRRQSRMKQMALTSAAVASMQARTNAPFQSYD